MSFLDDISKGAGIAQFVLDNKGYHEQRAFNERSANIANLRADTEAAKNIEAQKEFAQHGIQWKVEDAKRSGIHPLAALGAQTHSFAPVSVGTATPTYERDTSFADMGQNLSRSIAATQTEAQRLMERLQLENASLQNEKLRTEIGTARQAQIGPPFPGTDNFLPGQGNSGLVIDKPLERTVSAPGRPAQEAGWRPDVAYSRTDTGLVPMVPEGLSESLEDDVVGKIFWRIRNQLMPNLGSGGSPDPGMLPKGSTHWKWSHGKQEFQPRSNSRYRNRRNNFLRRQ